MTTDILTEAETLLRDIAKGVTTPAEHECLLCFVHRELAEFGCDETLRFARRYRNVAAPRATALEARLGDVGGFCDCEILLNGYVVASRFWTPSREIVRDGYIEIVDPEPPATAPPCTGVRKGVDPTLFGVATRAMRAGRPSGAARRRSRRPGAPTPRSRRRGSRRSRR